MSATMKSYLPEDMPTPVAEADGLSEPFWNGLRENKLLIQHCGDCRTWQFGPEWICHHCHAFDPGWEAVAPQGVIYSWQRVWHPVRPNLKQHGPYLIVLVELPHAGGTRLVGNLLGDPMQEVVIGSKVNGVFEAHDQASPPYTLLQWTLAE